VSDERRCASCGQKYPLTAEYWHKFRDGFHTKCRNCRNSIAKKKRKSTADSRLRQIEKGAVRTFLAAARLGGSNVPHSAELMEVLYSYFGGTAGFANIWLKQYFDAPPGGAFRTKMLETIMRLTTNNTAMGGAKKPLTLWSEDELEQELNKRVIEAATVINAIACKPSDGTAGGDQHPSPIASLLSPVLGGDGAASGPVDSQGGGEGATGTE